MTGYFAEPGTDISTSEPGDRMLPLRNLIAAVRHRWWLVLLVFAAVVAFSSWRTARQTRLYRAAATVRIQESAPMVTGIQAPTARDFRIDPIQSEQLVIKSQAIGERVAQQLGLQLTVANPPKLKRSELLGRSLPSVDSTLEYGEYTVRLNDDGYALYRGSQALGSARYGASVTGGGLTLQLPEHPRVDERKITLRIIPLAAAGGIVRSGIGTRGLPQTNIVEIAYTGPDPVVVMQTANAVAGAYRTFSSEQRRKQAQDRTAFIIASLEEQRGRLSAAQEALRRFKEQAQISSTIAEQSAHSEKINEFQSQLEKALVEQRIYQTLLGGLAAADTATEELRKLSGTEALQQNQQIQNLFSRWFELTKEREQIMAPGRNARHPDVKAVDRVLVGVKEELAEASGLYLRALSSRIGSIQSRIGELRKSMEKYPSLEAQESRLAADVRTAQTLYDQLQSEYQRARIAESGESGYVQLIDAASQPTAPISPNRRRIFFTAVIFGLILGVGAAVLFENFDDSVKSPEEVRDQLGLPVVGTIPAIKETGAEKKESDGAGRRLVTHLDPRSPVAESYRSLRTNLAFARAHEALRTIVLTSPGPADGKSTTVANLAITFAQQGQRTLLIDADLRRAVLDKMFNVPRSPGLTEVLVGKALLADAVHATGIENLSVLGSGPFPPNPSELLGSSAMLDVLREAQDSFDVILLDSPPLLAVTDAAVLATIADGAILVVRMGSTAKAAVRRAVGQLQAVHGRLVGSVLNDVDFRHGSYGGQYGYYYYYYYGQDGGRNGRGAMDRIRRWTKRGSKARHREG